MTYEEIRAGKGRVLCPKCSKKGVGFANHPFAFGVKDHDIAQCRYCGTRFKVDHPAWKATTP